MKNKPGDLRCAGTTVKGVRCAHAVEPGQRFCRQHSDEPGRSKSKRTPERIERILGYIRDGNSRKTAALSSGIGERTLQEWVAGDEELRARIEAAEEQFIAAQVDVIRKAAARNWTAAAWLLERKRPDDFGRRNAVDVTTSGSPLGPQVVLYLPDNGRDDHQAAEGPADDVPEHAG